MRKETNMAKKLRWMPLNKAMKEKIVQANILTAGLYGVEAADMNRSALNALRAAIAKAIGPGSGKRNMDITYMIPWLPMTLTPYRIYFINVYQPSEE